MRNHFHYFLRSKNQQNLQYKILVNKNACEKRQNLTSEFFVIFRIKIKEKSIRLKNKLQTLLSSSAFRRKDITQVPLKNNSLIRIGFRKVSYEYLKKQQENKTCLRIIEEILAQSTNSIVAQLLLQRYNNQVSKCQQEQDSRFQIKSIESQRTNKQQSEWRKIQKIQHKKVKNILIIRPK